METLKARPSQVTVDIRNATGAQGRATAASAQLTPQGFQVTKLSTSANARKATTIRYSQDELGGGSDASGGGARIDARRG